ncbi:MAG: mechanosensitive ion channel [Muribaculum sp.]|nr:mechanosensitive ion channel [Muribaculum sp.]
MLQSDITPVVDLPDIESGKENALSALKGLSFDDAIATIAESIVSFSFRLLLAIVILYIGKFIIKRLYKTVSGIMIRRKVDASLTTFTLSLIKIVTYFILIIIVISILGIETSSFIALFASAGVAIGMALSGTLQNFAGGVLILLLKPYKVGDFIEVQGYAGTVGSISIFNTIINTPDNKSIIIPNGALSTASINNYSMEKFRRVDWSIGLSYSTDFDSARNAILEMLSEDQRVLTNQSEEAKEISAEVNTPIIRKRDMTLFVGLNNLGDNSIEITVRAWTRSSDYWGLYFDMNGRFYKELPKKGFEFPFPQLDVHMQQ